MTLHQACELELSVLGVPNPESRAGARRLFRRQSIPMSSNLKLSFA
jgi:hypothetical protein